MRTIVRTKLYRVVASAVMAIGTFSTAGAISACSGDAQTSVNEVAPQAGATAPKWDGESLVRGVFFGQGEVGKHLFGDRAAVPNEDGAARVDAIVSRLLSGDSAALEAFARDVQSGDVARVRDAATAMGKRLHDVEQSLVSVWQRAPYILVPPVLDYVLYWAAATPLAPSGQGLETDAWARDLAVKLATPYAFDGEAAFRGIFFSQGEAGKRVAPELASSAAQAEAADVVVGWIRAHDPSFFASFGVDAQSGDMLRVRGAIDRGVDRIDAVRRDLAKHETAVPMPMLHIILPLPPYLAIVFSTEQNPASSGPGLARDALAQRVADRMAAQ